MADHRLRQHERNAALAPSVEARAVLLRARVRAGSLRDDQVTLAALCGDEAALAVLPPKVTRWQEGYLCCCGSLDKDHGFSPTEGWWDGHGPVHACDYYKMPCDCELKECERVEDPVIRPRTLRELAHALIRSGPVATARAEVAAAKFIQTAWEQRARTTFFGNLPRSTRAVAAVEWEDRFFSRRVRPVLLTVEAAETWVASVGRDASALAAWERAYDAAAQAAWLPCPPSRKPRDESPIVACSRYTSISAEQIMHEVEQVLIDWSLE